MKRLITPNVGENVEQLKLSYHIGVSLKWYNHFGKSGYDPTIYGYDSIIYTAKAHLHKNVDMFYKTSYKRTFFL